MNISNRSRPEKGLATMGLFPHKRQQYNRSYCLVRNGNNRFSVLSPLYNNIRVYIKCYTRPLHRDSFVPIM